MPVVTKYSEFLSEPEKFTLATKLYPLVVSVSGDNVVIFRLEGWYGKTKQKVEVSREYENVSQKSLRRLHRVLARQINAGKATIELDQIAGFTCYEVSF